MDRFDNGMSPADAALEQRLRSERPELSAIQLDAVKANVRRRVTGGGSAPAFGRSFMKSRLALTMILVLGVMMSTTGATIAITGASDNGSAGVAQYGQNEEEGAQQDDLAGQDQGGGGGGDNPQPTEQVAAQGDSGSLPFTGFVAIPLLIGGVALIGTGAVLRRRAQ